MKHVIEALEKFNDRISKMSNDDNINRLCKIEKKISRIDGRLIELEKRSIKIAEILTAVLESQAVLLVEFTNISTVLGAVLKTMAEERETLFVDKNIKRELMN